MTCLMLGYILPLLYLDWYTLFFLRFNILLLLLSGIVRASCGESIVSVYSEYSYGLLFSS